MNELHYFTCTSVYILQNVYELTQICLFCWVLPFYKGQNAVVNISIHRAYAFTGVLKNRHFLNQSLIHWPAKKIRFIRNINMISVYGQTAYVLNFF